MCVKKIESVYRNKLKIQKILVCQGYKIIYSAQYASENVSKNCEIQKKGTGKLLQHLSVCITSWGQKLTVADVFLLSVTLIQWRSDGWRLPPKHGGILSQNNN